MLFTRDDLSRGCAALLAFWALAGCSAGSDTASSDRVATIAGASSGPSAATPSAQEGVMLRIDMTDDERQAVDRAWYACLGTNGVRMAEKLPGVQVPAQTEKQAPAGYRACKAKEPYLDPLLDKTRNPQYADQFRAWLACMNSQGVEVSGSPDDEFLDFGKRAPGIDSKKYLQIYRQCEMASYKW
jgi:hypothetical protein